MPHPRRISTVLVVAVLAGVGLTGCSATVPVPPAPDANDPACAQVMVQLPGTLAGQDRRWTDGQSTAAWGSSKGSAVILSCGLVPPGPSELPCRTVRAVDWILDGSEAPKYRATTFGRTPALQVFLDTDVVSSADVLDRLSVAANALPLTGRVCTERPAS